MEKPAKQGAGAAGSKPLTTFVHTDTNAFREIVQRLTGPSETSAAQDGEATKVAGVKRTTSKLHERRQYMRPKLEIVKPICYPKSGSSSRNSSFPPSPISGNSSRLPSPTTPSTIFSQLSIQDEEKQKESPILVELNKEEEEKAIKERRFYLHPSPPSKPAGYTEPELLPLFPLASPTSEKV